MKYTTLGRTGVTVSRLCLGCMSYGDAARGGRGSSTRGAAQPFFRRAVEAGINFFDTADMYSLGVSEEVTGPRPARVRPAGGDRPRHEGLLPDGDRARTWAGCRASTSCRAARRA